MSDSVRLPGEHPDAVFVLAHGFGMTSADLMPLALSLNGVGYTCVVLRLAGHETTASLGEAGWDDWRGQLLDACRRESAAGRRVFVAGFSLGAVLALDAAVDNEDVAGVLGISTFLGPRWPYLTRVRGLLRRLVPRWAVRRYLQVTVRSLRKQIPMIRYLPVGATESLIAEVRRRRDRLAEVRCLVLLIHSLDNRVASYRRVAEWYHAASAAKKHVITLRDLNHFLQFDVPPARVRDVTLRFFGLDGGAEAHWDTEDDLLATVVSQAGNEVLHWSRLLFQVVMGYFSVFGALVYFSLEKVLLFEAGAPYFLIAYALASSLAVVLLSLYFYYLNRSVIYLRQYVEPRLRGMSAQTFKTLEWASGRRLSRLTRSASLPLFLLPGAISLGSLAAVATLHHDRIFELDSANVLLQISFLVAAVLFLYGLRVGLRLGHSNRELRLATPAGQPDPVLEEAVVRLYASVKPGCVRLPPATG